MRKIAIITCLLAVTVATGYAVQVTLQYFQAKSNGTSVSIEWKSGMEPEGLQYEVERAGEDNQFRYVATSHIRIVMTKHLENAMGMTVP